MGERGREKEEEERVCVCTSRVVAEAGTMAME